LGVPIWYEEPAWAFSGDLVNAAQLEGNREAAAQGWTTNIIATREGRLDVALPSMQALRLSNPTDIIERVLSNHLANNNAGEFKVIPFGQDEFSIVGVRAADRDGRIVRQLSPLDKRISFPEEDRLLTETRDLILRKVDTALIVGRQGSMPDLRRVRIGAKNEVARDVLARTMQIPGSPKMSFDVNYSPQHGYYVWMSPVKIEVRVPGGDIKLQTLYWPK
jgi:hypothetical protein